VKVLRRMVPGRAVAATDVAANKAHPQMDPNPSRLEAFFTSLGGAGFNVSNLVYVRAGRHTSSLRIKRNFYHLSLIEPTEPPAETIKSKHRGCGSAKSTVPPLREQSMKNKLISIFLGLGATVAAFGAHLPSGTEVTLVFRQPVSSRTAHTGDHVMMAIANDVYGPHGHLALKAGTPVVGMIQSVNKRSHFGVNAKIRIAINPVNGIWLEPRDKGSQVGGTRTDEAVAASGGAALVLGPIGLVGGYFVVGHNVNIHPGQRLRTVVTG
jgi:hypothetical protein